MTKSTNLKIESVTESLQLDHHIIGSVLRVLILEGHKYKDGFMNLRQLHSHKQFASQYPSVSANELLKLIKQLEREYLLLAIHVEGTTHEESWAIFGQLWRLPKKR